MAEVLELINYLCYWLAYALGLISLGMHLEDRQNKRMRKEN
jgi:hypothetical protein